MEDEFCWVIKDELIDDLSKLAAFSVCKYQPIHICAVIISSLGSQLIPQFSQANCDEMNTQAPQLTAWSTMIL